MLSVYCGNDVIKVREKAFGFIGEKETAGVRVNRIDSDTFASGALADALGASSLFGGEELYVIDSPSTHAELQAELENNLTEMAESNNQFVVIEGVLLAPAKKKYQKFTESFEELKTAAGERFNAFGMADALARRDKKSLWLLFAEAKQHGLSDEEIIGVLWWQLKTLLLAKKTKSAGEAGIKDFPYNKAKRALGAFKEDELETLAHSLLTLYHEGHGGVRDLSLALESWILSS